MAAILACHFPGAALAAGIHVAPNGNDANPGTREQPLATMETARDAVRKIRGAGNPAEPVTVWLHGGTYQLTKTLRLEAQDSGTDTSRVLWRAAGDGEVVLSGGLPIPPSALRPVTDPATLARLPAGRDPALKLYEIRLTDIGRQEFPRFEPHGFGSPYESAWPELFLAGQPLPLAAWPNGTGYANGFKPTKIISSGTTAKVTAGGASATANVAPATPMVFAFANARADRWRIARDTHMADVWIGGHWFWDWADDFLPVSNIAGGGVITIGKRHGYGIGKHVNLHVYNLAEEMDAPGEYALEPAQKRILILLSNAQARAPLSLSWLGTPLIQLEKCAHLGFAGLCLTNSRGDGVRLNQAADVVFSHCSWRGLGRNGITAKGDHIVVEDGLFSQIGSIGVSIDGGERKSLTSGHNRVSHCEFTNFSRHKRTYSPGVGVNGVGTTVENCLFHGSPHTAILFGGNEHLIRNNEIHSVLTETGDCGAIYGGRDWTACGTTITGNWIHNLGGLGGRWPCAIYLDDALSGITVTNNYVEAVSLGILVGGGRYDTVQGNLFSKCDEGMHLDSRGVGWMGGKGLDTLKKRLAEMPVNQAPWTTRYPHLKDTLKNDPGKPVGTRITGNATVGCKHPWKAKSPVGVATVAPNWENCKGQKLIESNRKVSLSGTPLVFTKPSAGVRK